MFLLACWSAILPTPPGAVSTRCHHVVINCPQVSSFVVKRVSGVVSLACRHSGFSRLQMASQYGVRVRHVLYGLTSTPADPICNPSEEGWFTYRFTLHFVTNLVRITSQFASGFIINFSRINIVDIYTIFLVDNYISWGKELRRNWSYTKGRRCLTEYGVTQSVHEQWTWRLHEHVHIANMPFVVYYRIGLTKAE
jgi:hypothetical protein